MAVHISKILDGIFSRETGLSRVVHQASAVAIWEGITRERGFGAAEPTKVRGGVLYVKAPNSVLAQELSLRKAELLKEVNDRMKGAEVLTDIRFQKS